MFEIFSVSCNPAAVATTTTCVYCVAPATNYISFSIHLHACKGWFSHADCESQLKWPFLCASVFNEFNQVEECILKHCI